MQIVIAPFEKEDLAPWVHIWNRDNPMFQEDVLTLEENLEQHALAGPYVDLACFLCPSSSAGRMVERDVGWRSRRPGAQLVGRATLGRYAGMADKGLMALTLHVDALHRCKGVGGFLWETIQEDARRLAGAPWCRTNTVIKESDGECALKFARDRGFAEYNRRWYSLLDVHAYSLETLDTRLAKLAEQGYVVSTFAGERAQSPEREEALWHEMHDFDFELMSDVPFPEPIEQEPFESYRRFMSGSSMCQEGWILVRFQGELVGICVHQLAPAADEMNIWMTGVKRGHRGKGVARAIKEVGIRFAKDLGKKRLGTYNDPSNPAILNLNISMGFVRQPANIWMKRSHE